MELDKIDRSIMRVLQEDGRLQNNELAERVGLSASACLRRVKSLEKLGVIHLHPMFVRELFEVRSDVDWNKCGCSLFAEIRNFIEVGGFVKAVKFR